MNSTLKTALPIVLVILMVFGITVMSQFVAPTKPRGDATEADTAPALVVGNADRFADPGSPLEIYRSFPGYFEVGSDARNNRVGFFVRNARSSNIFITALAPSCANCTSARGAVIPPADFRNYLQHVAIGPLWSSFPTGDLVSALAWRHTQEKLQWTEFAFNNPDVALEVPAATEGEETWALLELGFTMSAVGPPAPKHAYFDVYSSDRTKLTPKPFEFTVVCGGREVQELVKYEFDVGDLTESNPTHTFEVLAVSALNPNLPVPVLRPAEAEPHVKIGDAQRLSPEALESLSLNATFNQPGANAPVVVNYRSGYRFVVTVSRDAAGKTMDVGQFEKDLFAVGGPGVTLQKPHRVRIQGNVAGVIRLEVGTKIEFGSYDGNFTQKNDLRVWTERKDVTLEVVQDLCRPNFIKAKLGPPTVEAGRTYWNLTVQIPEKEGKSPPWDGIVYLRAKAPELINVRIPVSGHGR